VLREYVEAMRALWTQEEASYAGEFVSFGASWAYPKPVQAHVPLLIGAGGTDTTFDWIVAHADGWITTPGETEIDDQVASLRAKWAAAGRTGQPEVVALGGKPSPNRMEHLASIGVTEAVFGLPDRDEPEVVAYLARTASRLALPRP
jgi:alkanesulfonate monooxygenase SsuD/methylene tetrahydromethanopterin reductase-like flavin-dependent oxidoreductase (luciferase family)